MTRYLPIKPNILHIQLKQLAGGILLLFRLIESICNVTGSPEIYISKYIDIFYQGNLIYFTKVSIYILPRSAERFYQGLLKDFTMVIQEIFLLMTDTSFQDPFFCWQLLCGIQINGHSNIKTK